MTTDETRPLLLRPNSAENGTIKAVNVTNIIDFDPNSDPDNPRDWQKLYKWGIVALLAFQAFTVTFTCISPVPIAPRIVYDLEDKDNKSASVLLVTIWEFG
jgi:hypothetical protein